ncbi:MAP microtubule affinity-regulating kinase 1 [Dinochytrium kinnereticum]|nr:MAP microtubule affinity-regulating kinase 1 [Dinochytrium kinnereticum]
MTKKRPKQVAIKIIDKKQMAIKAAKAKKANEDRERRKRAEREQQQKNQGQPQPTKSAGTSPQSDQPAPASASEAKPVTTEESAKNAGGEGEKPKTGEAGSSSTPSFVSALQLEVQLLMRLDHPNVITLYQVMETEDECYVVMEFASGGELIEYIAARNHLNEKEARRFFRQLISAMDHCHMANVVHRDLKLENLLLTDNKTLIISDFGLGRTFQNDTDEYMKTFCGTPNYAAVELISGIPYIGVKSDIWAMGVVLYVMMTGKPPFTGENISALYSKIKAVDYTCPDYFSSELKALFGKILKKDPKARIDMDGLRTDPWVNMGEDEPPLRVVPKVMGPPTSAQVGQFIASITRDSDCIIYTIRNHMRDGKSINGAPDKNKQPLQRRKTSSASLVGPQRRRSSSFAPPPNAQDLRPQPSPSRSVSPGSRAAIIREDGEDEIGELPARGFNGSGSLPRASRTGGRRLSLLETSKPSPLSNHLSTRSTQPPAPTPTPSMAPDHNGSAEMGKKEAPPYQRKRRNTITLLFGGGKEDGAPSSPVSPLFGMGSHARSSTEEPRGSPTSSAPSTADETSSGCLSGPRSSVGANGAPTAVLPEVCSTMSMDRRGGRGRRATITTGNGDDRSLNLMRRMSMVTVGPKEVSPTQSAFDSTTSPSSTIIVGTTITDSTTSTRERASSGDKMNVSIGGVAETVVPSKQEIEDWHLMHRPAKEIRAVRYNFSSKTTSTLNPAAIFQEVHRVLLILQRQYDNRIGFSRVDDFYQLNCRLAEPNSENDVEFEVEVCKIWLLKVHGIRIKRLSGSAFVFRDIYASIVDELNL